MNISELYNELFLAIFERIEEEMSRAYWNVHQEDMWSPFRNTGGEYANDTFEVRAYYWGNDEELENLPNFSYKNGEFTATWYKYVGRNLNVECKVPITLEYLNTMLNDCIESIEKEEH